MNVMVKKEWIEKGYVDEPVDEALDLKAEIKKLCKEKDAIILAHYYTVGEIQDNHCHTLRILFVQIQMLLI